MVLNRDKLSQRFPILTLSVFLSTNIKMALMFIGTCIILIVEWRETNLMSLAFLFHYFMLNMFRMLIHPSSGAYDLFVELFHGLYWSGMMSVGVTVWFGWDATPPQPNHNVTPTRIVPEQYNPWNNSTHKSQAPEDGCINIRNMLSMK
jgi:hypothetical protein